MNSMYTSFMLLCPRLSVNSIFKNTLPLKIEKRKKRSIVLNGYSAQFILVFGCPFKYPQMFQNCSELPFPLPNPFRILRIHKKIQKEK